MGTNIFLFFFFLDGIFYGYLNTVQKGSFDSINIKVFRIYKCIFHCNSCECHVTSLFPRFVQRKGVVRLLRRTVFFFVWICTQLCFYIPSPLSYESICNTTLAYLRPCLCIFTKTLKNKIACFFQFVMLSIQLHAMQS